MAFATSLDVLVSRQSPPLTWKNLASWRLRCWIRFWTTKAWRV